MKKILNGEMMGAIFRLYLVVWMILAGIIVGLITLVITPKVLQALTFLVIIGLFYKNLNWLVVTITAGFLSLIFKEKKKS